jgi:hypothetical protein
MERLVQPELMAGLFARSVDTEILAAFAIVSHVSPACTTRVMLQVVGGGGGGGCTRKHKRAGERSTRKSSKSLGQKGKAYESNRTGVVCLEMHKT